MSSKLTITTEESARFAALSGDYNPIHTDETAARRLMYGRTVVHGIHTLCAALETWAEAQQTARRITAITADFKNPVHVGESLEYESGLKNDQHILLVKKQGATVLRVRLSSDDANPCIASVKDEKPPEELPLILSDTELTTAKGSVPLMLATAVAVDLFPHLVRNLGPATLATLCATTRIVGMKCPGMHSLYARLQLDFTATDATADELGYEVESYDERFGMLELKFTAPGITGSALCYRRPAPVEQAGVGELAQRVAAAEFAGQRALVIGGSRGLGRYTAALIAAGGGDVTVTWRSGKAEADEIVADIRANGRNATALQLDAARPDWLEELGELDFTHIYYFASPKISANTGEFDAVLYARFRTLFVDAPVALLKQVAAGGSPVHLFIPSTIYVSEPEPGFAEYIRAKTEMEEECTAIADANTQLKVSMPRLPRLETDQTAGLGAEEFADTGDVLIPLLRTL